MVFLKAKKEMKTSKNDRSKLKLDEPEDPHAHLSLDEKINKMKEALDEWEQWKR